MMTETLSRRTVAVLVSLLSLHAGLLAYSAGVHSATWDEVGHLVAGVSHWKFGRFELYSVNPPLVRGVATLPVSLMKPATDWTEFKPDVHARSEVKLGRKFFDVNGASSHHYLVVARWTCIPFSITGAVLCFVWARSLYGSRSGLLAAGIWCFSPTVLGHGALMTPDVAAATMAMAVLFTVRRFLLQPHVGNAALVGLVFGLALLVKTTLVTLGPIAVVIWAAWRKDVWLGRRWHELKREVGYGLLASIIAVFVVNGGYAFRGTGTRLSEFRFISTTLAGPTTERAADGCGNRFEGSWLGSMPVPLPREMVLGMDLQKRDFERGFIERGYQSYLLGKWRQGGWWYYYLVVIAVKEPLGLWVIGLCALYCCWKSRPQADWREDLLLLLPSFGLFALVSSQIGMNHHYRYVFPALPFLVIWMSQAALMLEWSSRWKVAISGAVVWFVGSSLWYYPHSLSYFNELAGGPKNGYRVLNNSNVDWGQDLFYLKDWLDAHPHVKSDDFRFAYFGNFNPALFGVYFRPPHPLYNHTWTLPEKEQKWLGPKPGWYAVSVNYLTGHTMPMPEGNGQFKYYGQPVFEYFREFEPIARAGYSIYIYWLELDDVNRVRRKLKLPELDR